MCLSALLLPLLDIHIWGLHVAIAERPSVALIFERPLGLSWKSVQRRFGHNVLI